jgi:hypothetical protein
MAQFRNQEKRENLQHYSIRVCPSTFAALEQAGKQHGLSARQMVPIVLPFRKIEVGA